MIENLPPPGANTAGWYQWYFHTERGEAGLERNRREICRFAMGTLVPQMEVYHALFD